MQRILLVLLLLWSSSAMAGVINVEFKFTPFVGDPIKSSRVETVPGKAAVFINNVLMAEKQVDKREVPVLFEEREIAPSVWLPVESLGPVLRKGKNKIRIEFEPTDSKVPYRAQLRWASVTDQVTKVQNGPGQVKETNQSDEGVDDKKTKGRVVFEREFIADFAADLPWHHYPPVITLSAKDKQDLAMLVNERAKAFKPDFAEAYKILKNMRDLNLTEMKKAKCLEKAYTAGVRFTVQPVDKIDFVTTGNPEVVVRGKAGSLFNPPDPKAFDRIKGDEVQMCAGIALSILYPPHLVFIHTPSGKWEVVY
jgi:hypothetical protein